MQQVSSANCILKINNIETKNIHFNNIISKRKQTLITKDDNKIDKTIHYIDILYNNDPLYIQIADCKIIGFNEKTNNVKIEIDNKLLQFIKSLEEFMIEKVHKNSEKLFYGKIFTMNKIRSSFISNIKQNVLTTTFEKNGLIFDQSKKQIGIENILEHIKRHGYIDGIFILKLANLQFMDKYFTYNFVLEQSKIHIKEMPNKNYLDVYSIIDTSSEESKISSITSKYDGAEYKEYHNSE